MNSSGPPIRFHVAHTPAKAAAYLLEALDNNENVNGSFTERCSQMLEAKYGIPNVLLTHSATAALELSAMVLASSRGANRAFMPSYTFSSTANAFLRAGYELEFLDIDPMTMSLPLSEVVAADIPPNSVIVPVHYAGNPGDVAQISSHATATGTWVVEDAAQALGAGRGGASAGSFGALSAISFHFTKNVHSSMGGALFINDPDLLDLATVIWERGTDRQAMLKGLVDKYSWVDVGSSFQTTELQAALLLAGLEEYDTILEQRRLLWEGYRLRLDQLDDKGLFLQEWSRGTRNNYHAFYVRLDTTERADSLRVALRASDIHAYIGYVPLHTAPYGIERGLNKHLPMTETWASRILRLPLHTAMSPGDMERVADTILAWLSDR